MATKPKTQIMSHDDTVMSPITKASNVLFEDGKTAQDKLEDNVEKSFTPSVENSSSMFKVGQGDSVDYSDNVLDGAYEECVLKGRSLVNCIQEPSSQDVILPYEFTEGQYVTINDTKESGALGVELKGQTLVNRFDDRCYDLSNWSGSLYRSFYFDNLEAGKEYVFYAPFKGEHRKRDTAVQLMIGNRFLYQAYGDSHDTINVRFTLNEHERLYFDNYVIWGDNLEKDYPKILILESQYYYNGIPYFEGMASVKAPTVTMTGKNLFDLASASNGFLSTNAPYSLARPDYHNKTSSYVRVKPNTKYTYSFDGFAQSQVGNLYWTGFYYYKRVGEVSTVHPSRMTFTGVNQISFTTPSDCNYIRIGSRGLMLDGATVQLEESTTTTTYEPYKSTTLTLPDEVVLRSLHNGVCDTFNARTGEYVQRVGETTFTGNEQWGIHSKLFTEKLAVFSVNNNFGYLEWLGSRSILCDKLPVLHERPLADSEIEGVYDKDGWAGKNRIPLVIKKSRLSTVDIDGLKLWLSQNPISIQYELATPIITKINLPSTLKPHNTLTHIYSEIPQNSLYPILSHSNPTYPVILKPSTKYSIVANSYSNNHTNSPINFNLGGATASTTVGNRVTMVTTPSTLSNELLTMSGRGNKLNNIMVIEGDVVGDEPYFEGICDVKSPVVKNVGKNLFDTKEFIDDRYIASTGAMLKDSNSVDRNASPFIKVRPKTAYIFSGMSRSGVTNSGKNVYYCEYDSHKNTIKTHNIGVASPYVLTTTQNTAYIRTTVKDEDLQTCVMEESSTPTTYEPYKSNTTIFNQEDGQTIVLRSLPNGVCDTLNVETGEYVRRIGEVVLSGTENENWNNFRIDSMIKHSQFYFRIEDKLHYSQVICDNFISIPRQISDTGGECISGDGGNGKVIWINILNSRLPSLDVNGFKSWLSQNPITVQYELATPVVSTIDVQGFPYAYKDGHVQLSSGYNGQSLTPKIEYSLPINRNGQIRMNQAMVERHQKHIDKLQAIIITNMVNTQYRQSLTKINYQLGGEQV